MKLTSNNLLENLRSEVVANLLKITDEKIATNFSKNRKRVFTAAELYEIQKRKRNFSVRRFSLA